MLIGGLLSLTNLYVGAKTGWTLGVGITSVILAFAAFKVIASLGLAKEFTILENNAMQSIATAAGYMTGPLISGLAAYMMVENRILPWHQMLLFNVVLSLLGVLVAFPMKRRFINDEQAPFPEGAACGVVLDTLYSSAAAVGLLIFFQANPFVAAGFLIAAVCPGAPFGPPLTAASRYSTPLTRPRGPKTMRTTRAPVTTRAPQVWASGQCVTSVDAFAASGHPCMHEPHCAHACRPW